MRAHAHTHTHVVLRINDFMFICSFIVCWVEIVGDVHTHSFTIEKLSQQDGGGGGGGDFVLCGRHISLCSIIKIDSIITNHIDKLSTSYYRNSPPLFVVSLSCRHFPGHPREEER